MQNKSWDFVGKLKIFLCITLTIIITGIVVNFIFGTELDINFKGGSTISYSFENEIDHDKVEATVKKALGADAKISESEDFTTGNKNLVITIVGDLSVSTDELNILTTALQKDFDANKLAFSSVNSVSPSIGKSFFQKSLYALFIAAIFVILYVGIRFRNIGGVSAAVTALIALLHDVIIVYFVNVLLRIPLDDNFIAVELTILGYSLNDTIVIYDRIRENSKIYGTTLSHRELVNLSITQTFRRSIITSLATFISISTISVVALISGLDSILSFSIPMSIGVVIGSFTTICLAGPLYVKWLEFKDKNDLNKPNKKKSKKPYYKTKKA